MTDTAKTDTENTGTENTSTGKDASAAPQDSALRPAGSDLHPADPTDDLTGNTPAADEGAGSPGAPRDVAPHGVDLDDAVPGDRLPGDGTIDPGERPHEEDALRTAEYGRESAAARADTSDGTPRPTETPAD